MLFASAGRMGVFETHVKYISSLDCASLLTPLGALSLLLVFLSLPALRNSSCASEYCTAFALPVFIELCLLTLLIVWWVIAAAAFMFTKANGDIEDVTGGTRTAVRVCSWLLVVLFLASAFLCWRIAKNEQAMDAFDIREQNLNDTGYQHQDAGYRQYV